MNGGEKNRGMLLLPPQANTINVGVAVSYFVGKPASPHKGLSAKQPGASVVKTAGSSPAEASSPYHQGTGMK
jgi:hypothetical protein